MTLTSHDSFSSHQLIPISRLSFSPTIRSSKIIQTRVDGPTSWILTLLLGSPSDTLTSSMSTTSQILVLLFFFFSKKKNSKERTRGGWRASKHCPPPAFHPKKKTKRKSEKWEISRSERGRIHERDRSGRSGHERPRRWDWGGGDKSDEIEERGEETWSMYISDLGSPTKCNYTQTQIHTYNT